MRKIVALSFLALGACQPPLSDGDSLEPINAAPRQSVGTEAAKDAAVGRSLPYGLNLWVDPDTGCEYFVPYGQSSYGLMPRTSADGFHQVCSHTVLEARQ